MLLPNGTALPTGGSQRRVLSTGAGSGKGFPALSHWKKLGQGVYKCFPKAGPSLAQAQWGRPGSGGPRSPYQGPNPNRRQGPGGQLTLTCLRLRLSPKPAETALQAAEAAFQAAGVAFQAAKGLRKRAESPRSPRRVSGTLRRPCASKHRAPGKGAQWRCGVLLPTRAAERNKRSRRPPAENLGDASLWFR